MVISVLDTRVECKTKGKNGSKVAGYAVGLQKKQEGNPAQQWRFTKDGNISSAVIVFFFSLCIFFLMFCMCL